MRISKVFDNLYLCHNQLILYKNVPVKKLLSLLLIFFLLKPFSIKAQFVVNDDAAVTLPECSDSSTTYLLTPNANNQDGEIWYTKKVSLTQRFDIEFQMYLGSKSYSVGADGICFVFQQLSVTAGSSGGGLGYGGITPSLAVEFDTYQNGWDPAYCHTAIEKNGDVNHTDLSGNNLAGPVQLDPSNPNLPDGAWHNMEIIWDPVSKTISVYYDCNLRISYTGDIINDIFGGNPNVYWGFTAGTGGSDNNQEICIGHSYLNNLRDTNICPGDSVPLSVSGGVSYSWSPNKGLSSDTGANVIAAPDSTTKYIVSVTNSCGLISTDSITISVNAPPTAVVTGIDSVCAGKSTVLYASGGVSYSWSPNKGLSSDTGANVTATPDSTTKYYVSVTNSCGLKSTDSITIFVNPLPEPVITGIDSVCPGKSTTLSVSSGAGTYSYLWSNGNTTSTISVTPGTTQTYSVVASSDKGCTKDTSFTVYIKPLPNVTITNRETICQGDSITLIATGGGSYLWNNGSTSSAIVVSPAAYSTYSVTVNKNGCIDSAKTSVAVDVPNLNACCTDTINLGDTVTIEAWGQSNYSWLPADGLNCYTCPNPVASPSVTTTYTVTSTDSNGCSVERTVTVFVEIPCKDFNVPNVFTPNDDGINDDFVVKVLNPSSYSIIIYDRWGKKVYSSTDPTKYWNGRLNGTNHLAPDGVYYYIIKATCADNNYTKKGFVQVLGEK